MDTSILFAKYMGPVMLVSAAAMFVNRDRLKAMADEFMNSAALLFLAGLLALLLGLTVVIFHNLWIADWRVIITFYGWLMLFAGFARMMFPKWVRGLGAAMMKQDWLLVSAGVLNLALGAFLTYQGYLN